ncbi:universal stress protein [Oleiharenicola lentus]|uniref:universal stress protein n=1 Tax=Oleiharenicola lentus TaxID=2508720 RepID=UPI003F67EB33
MKTLLVPIDFSTVTKKVVAASIEFARSLRGRVVLVHVVIPPPPVTTDFSLPVGTMQEVILIGEKVAARRLATLVKKFRAARIKTEAHVLQGPPGYCIVEEAKRTKADYIIMGSHGHGKLYDLLVGSTASNILKHATCGVIVLPPIERKSTPSTTR